ncbi:MAG: hypothetical protein ACYSWP_10065 [Planctomycetota bacterium]|jgi:hypothetical protein
MDSGAKRLKIAVDLDGTISEYPDFFSFFTMAMAQAGCRIYVITDRIHGTEGQVAEELKSYNITYHVLKITSDKASFILDEGITVLFDDMDRYFRALGPEVAVFKIRQKYNFNFERMMWTD